MLTINIIPINSDDCETKKKLRNFNNFLKSTADQIQQGSPHQFFNCELLQQKLGFLASQFMFESEKYAFYTLRHSMYIATQGFRYFFDAHVLYVHNICKIIQPG